MKEVSLACTGGGVKSAINIGILRALEELNIKVTAISGASIGGCVAVLYAMGYSPKDILELYKTNIKIYSKFSILDIVCAIPNLLFRGGIKNPKIIEQSIFEISKQCNVYKMSDCKMPVIIPALDITKRETIYYSSKPLSKYTYYTDRYLSEAIRSTSSLPVIFIPNKTKINNKIHHMVDGGTTTNVPVIPLKEFSDFVIGVEAKYYNTKQRQKIHFFTAFTETFQAMRRSAHIYQKDTADLWLEIDVKRTKVFDTVNAIEYCEQCGYRAIMDLAKQGYFDDSNVQKHCECKEFSY